MKINYVHVSKLLYLYGFSMWITLITLNNILDPNTNIFFIQKMITMSDFDPSSSVGVGLLPRSITNSEFSKTISTVFLWMIVFIEIIIVFLMWRAFIKLMKVTLKNKKIDPECLNSINLALCSFLFLFILFITGGVFFGYWMHMGAFQLAHLISIIIIMLGFIYFNTTGEGVEQ